MKKLKSKSIHKDNMAKIAKRLRAIRRAASYSQEEVGRIIGVSHQQIQKYETATDRIPAVSLYIVAKKMGISIQEFFPGDGVGLSNDTISDEIWLVARKVMSIKDPIIRKRISSMILSLNGV